MEKAFRRASQICDVVQRTEVGTFHGRDPVRGEMRHSASAAEFLFASDIARTLRGITSFCQCSEYKP